MKKKYLLGILTICMMLAVFVGMALGEPKSVVANVDSNQNQTITVIGNGQISTEPDSASVAFAVVTQGKTAEIAQEENNKIMNNVKIFIEQMGIKKDNIETTNFFVWPEYNYSNEKTNKQPEIAGYKVSNELTVTVHDVNIVGKLVDGIIEAGANQVSSIKFFKEDQSLITNEALTLAAKDAKKKAETLANALDVKIISIVNVTESGGNVNLPIYNVPKLAATKEAYSLNIEPGQLKVNASVSITYKIN